MARPGGLLPGHLPSSHQVAITDLHLRGTPIKWNLAQALLPAPGLVLPFIIFLFFNLDNLEQNTSESLKIIPIHTYSQVVSSEREKKNTYLSW